jgi:glycerol kinase
MHAQNLTGGVQGGIHISEVTNASRTLLLNLRKLTWDERLLTFFGFRRSILPKLVSSSEVYGHLSRGPLKGVPIGGLIGDQQGALVGNKCLRQGEAKCTYGTGAFLLFCTGKDIVNSSHGLLSTVKSLLGASRNIVHESFARWLINPVQGLPQSTHWKEVVSMLFFSTEHVIIWCSWGCWRCH